MPTTTKIDFNRHPYRGIFSIVAQRLNKTPSNVRRDYYSMSPTVINEVNIEVKKIHNVLNTKKRLEQEAAHVSA